MRRLAATALGVALPAVAALALQPSAGAEPAAARIVDRTVACTIGKRAGIRKIEIHAQTGTRLFEGVVKEGLLAVRAPAGKPIAYAAVAESGKARLFVADGCEPDLISTDG